MPSSQETDLITLTEATKLTGLSRATLWRRYKAGRLPAAEPPNPLADRPPVLKFHRADVLALKPKPRHLDAAPPRLLAEEPPGYDPHDATRR